MDRKLLAIAASFLVAVGAGIDTVIQRATAGHPHARHAIYAVENEVTRLVRKGLVAATGSCGVERWPEKTLGTSDPASAALLTGTATLTNIPTLLSLTVPGGQAPSGFRVADTAETQGWRLAGTRVAAYKLEADSDYHLELRSPLNGATMIAEIPDPGCVSNPAAAAVIAQARDSFNRAVAPNAPTGYYQYTNLRVTLTGPAFFDFVHGQLGVAPSGVEIHPVLTFRVW